MQTVAMIVEGILREPNSEAAIAEGVTLYRGLAESSRLYLVSAMWTAQEMSRWLFGRGLESRHIGYRLALSPSAADRLHALAKIASWSPALVLESDPVCAAETLRHGYPTVLFAVPAYRAVSWRPDSAAVPDPWDTVAAEIQRQADLRYKDERLQQ